MNKISIDNIYIGILSDERENKIREIIFQLIGDKAYDIIYDTDEYSIVNNELINTSSSLKIINSVKLTPFLKILNFKDRLGLMNLISVYSLFMRDETFLENCSFLFGYTVTDDGNIVPNEKNLPDIFINQENFETLYNNAFLTNKPSKEEKNIHNVRLRKLI